MRVATREEEKKDKPERAYEVVRGIQTRLYSGLVMPPIDVSELCFLKPLEKSEDGERLVC